MLQTGDVKLLSQTYDSSPLAAALWWLLLLLLLAVAGPYE